MQAASVCSTAAMPWQLPEFEQERVDRARKLLKELEEHCGSLNLQVGPAVPLAPLVYPTARSPCVPHQSARLLSSSLQRYVEQMDATAELCNACLDERGQARQGLTPRERQQVRCSHPVCPASTVRLALR